MIKRREARYCNIKLLLIFLVIYGHLIEPFIETSSLLMFQYKLIYFFHMPLFCFMTGLFMKSERACLALLKKTLPLYFILQLPSVILKGRPLFLPNWVLWYLFSCCLWAAFIYLWHRFAGNKGKWAVLAVSVVAGCAAGYFEFVGRDFSLSRTVVFFPYVFLGVMWDPKFRWEKLRKSSIPGVLVAAGLIALVWRNVPYSFLYHADPFGEIKYGFVLRLVCYLIGALLSFFLLSIMTRKKLFCSVLGADTLWPYIIHWPVAILLKNYPMPWPIYLLIAAGLITAVYFAARLIGHKFEVYE